MDILQVMEGIVSDPLISFEIAVLSLVAILAGAVFAIGRHHQKRREVGRKRR